MKRDGFQCVRCGNVVSGEPGVGFSLQHRIPRGMGGSRDPRLNLPSNLVLLDGSGTTGCHGEVESHRADAEAAGYLVPRHLDPAEVPVTVAIWPASGNTPAVTIRYLLDDRGGRTEVAS
jgi:hypothetical protein